MENKQVILELVSHITQNHVMERIKQVHKASYHVVNGIHYIRFEDSQTGKNTLKIEKDSLICLWEKHAIKRIIFKKNELSAMLYHLPQSMMMFDVKTTQLSYDYNQQNYIHQIDLRYTLSENDSIFGTYHLTYTITF